jgi:transposase
MDSAELNAKPEAKTIRRIDVLTGPERRRQWSAEDKERIVSESFSGVDRVSRIARRHGLSPQQLFTWRREARQSGLPAAFASVALTPTDVGEAKRTALPAKATKKMASEVTVEIEAGSITVRIGRGAESATVAAIVRALKATS